MATCSIRELAARDGDGANAANRPVNVYVQLSDEPYAFGHILEAGRVVDYAADGTPIGVEFVAVDGCASVVALPQAEAIADALRRSDIPVCA